MTEDAEAIERCRGGDPGGFRTLVERYERQAVAHALTIVGNREDALDAVQDAMVDAYRALDRFDPARKFYPWFYVLLRNRCFKLLDRRRRRPGQTSLEAAEEPIVQVQATRGSELDWNDTLMSLSAEDREILLLKHLDGLTCNELAERLGIPAGTVMSRLFHARRRLREKLDSDE